MARKYLWLAVALLFAAGTSVRAEDKAAPAPQPATGGAMPSGPVLAEPAAAAAPVVVGAAPAAGAPCCNGGPMNAHGDCLHKLGAWLTYCPPKTPCHCGLCKCCGCGGCGCDGQKCTPCCIPLYMYFLDRCDCRLGFKTFCCVPPCPPANAGPGPAPAAAAQATAPAPTPAPEPLPAPVPLDGAANPKATSGR